MAQKKNLPNKEGSVGVGEREPGPGGSHILEREQGLNTIAKKGARKTTGTGTVIKFAAPGKGEKNVR